VARSIVCGVDGSIEAKAALRVASRPSEKLGLRLVVAYVTQGGLCDRSPARPGHGPGIRGGVARGRGASGADRRRPEGRRP
jgi:hypothetical protein